MKRNELAAEQNQNWFDGNAFVDNDNDPEFQAIATQFLCGDILAYQGSLTEKQKALLILATLTTAQTLNPLYKYTEAALKVGATQEEIKEALYQCTPYIGIEKVAAALDEVNFALSEADLTEELGPQGNVDEDTRFPVGLKVQQTIFGEENINGMRENAPKDLKHIQNYLSAYCFGDFYTRSGLDIQTRELIVFAALATLGGVAPQLKAHAAANLSVGNTRKELIDATTVLLPFIGFPRTLNTLAVIEEVTDPDD